jgi:hypothetical protein
MFADAVRGIAQVMHSIFAAYRSTSATVPGKIGHIQDKRLLDTLRLAPVPVKQ